MVRIRTGTPTLNAYSQSDDVNSTEKNTKEKKN